MISMILVILAAFVLPSFLRVSEVLVPGEGEERHDDDRLISIIHDDKP